MRYHQLIELIAHNKPQSLYIEASEDVRRLLMDEAKKHADPVALMDEPGGVDLALIRDVDDYDKVKDCPCIIIDNYTDDRIEKFRAIGDMVLLPEKDPDGKGGKKQLTVVPTKAWPGKYKVDIKTKNCVPDKNIQANIRYAKTLIPNWVKECRRNNETILMCSGGPSLKKHLDEIKKRKEKIVCVKHSHDILLDAGIKPWACMLLDPRGHVKDFVDNPQEGVLYITASMCHPTTVDALLKAEATVWGYNAYVGAGEEKILEEFEKDILIGGGSTSSIRGISVLYTLGFRTFEMYGYDLCYPGKPKKPRKTEAKVMKVDIAGREFWTDAEFLAESRDFEMLLDTGRDIEFTVHGDGVIPHVWAMKRQILPSYEEILG